MINPLPLCTCCGKLSGQILKTAVVTEARCDLIIVTMGDKQGLHYLISIYAVAFSYYHEAIKCRESLPTDLVYEH